MKIPISKSLFRIYQTVDAKTIIENPFSLDENGEPASSMLVISDSGITVGAQDKVFPSSKDEIVSTQESLGVIGILELCYGKYLLAITGRKLAATIQSHKIWRITNGVTIPIGAGVPESKIPDNDLEKYAIDQEILMQIREVILSGRMFYSNTYDVTHSLQHNYFSRTVKPVSTIVDNRYFFNEHLQSAIIQANQPDNNTSPWITKIIAGFAGNIEMDYVGNVEQDTRTYHTVLISRINHRRLGTRYARRGLDSDGNAANNVEMEQIVFHHDFVKDRSISSYIQLRGSVPSLWGQDLDLSYRPRLVLADINKESVWATVKNHYQDLKHQYIGERSVASGMDNGQVVCVNLLDDTGFEGPLTEIYESSVRRFGDPKIKYESFPMNKWCKKMNFTNMEILVDRVRLPLVNSGWFVAEGEVPSLYGPGTLNCSKIQTGVARVSCLDSLDRTNLTCSIFARYVIPYQVQAVSPGLPSLLVLPSTGITPTEVRDPVSTTRKALENSYRTLTNLWADSGDNISLMYAGTGALKADVTRTGKRQFIQGSYADGTNALTRYYLNNFQHGRLQDTYDVLTGKTNSQKILAIVSKDGKIKAARLKKPLVNRESFISYFIPSPVLDIVEPLYFNAREYLDPNQYGGEATSESFGNRIVLSLKEMAPKRINNILELVLVMVIFFWIILISKLLKITGQSVVNLPRINQEDKELKRLAR